MAFRTFTRTWYVRGPDKKTIVPGPGRKSYASGDTYATELGAVNACREWNATHSPGPLSRKMEYERVKD